MRQPTTTMRGYEAVNRLLVAAGVETVFQYMAEDTMELFADMERTHADDLSVIHTRHEQGAMAMADAYARAGSRIGVCIVGRGPGIAQTGTAMLNARTNGSRLLVIVPTPARDDDHDPKDFDQTGYLRSTIGDVLTVRSETTLLDQVTEGLRRTHLGESPVAVQVPKDILKGSIPDETILDDLPFDASLATTRPDPPRIEPDPDKIDAAVDLFLDADAYQPPVILAGTGAAAPETRETIETLAERLSAVLLTTLKNIDAFADHPFATGFSGSWGDQLSNEFLSEASYVLAIGCSLNDHTVYDGDLIADDATVVHVDADPASIGRFTPVDLGIVGDAHRTVEALIEAVDRAGIDREGELWTDDLRKRIADYSALDWREFPEADGAVDPRALTRKLETILPGARLVGNDGGQFRKWSFHALTARPEDSIVGCDFAAIGLGVPMGVGLGQYLKDERRANGEDRVAITFTGDGGFMMSIQELETAARHDIPLIVVLGNDSSLGSEYHYLDVQGDAAEVARIDTPNLADVSAALGTEAHRITALDDLDAIADRLQDPEGPVVLECVIDHEVRHHSY